MTSSSLISQGDGFIYDGLLSLVGSAQTDFNWPVADDWFQVPLNSPVPNSSATVSQYKYVNEDGNWQPPIAGWWQITGTARPYSGGGNFTHLAALFKGEIAPENLIVKTGGFRTVQAPFQVLVYMNGTTDYIQIAYYTTKPLPSTRSWSATQTHFDAIYIRP